MRTRRVLTAREQAECAAPDEVAAFRARQREACCKVGLEYAHLLDNWEPGNVDNG